MGVIYMILTMSVMVPMVLLTESLFKSLGSQLELSDLDTRHGNFERAWLNANGQYRKAFLDPNRVNCDELSRLDIPNPSFEVREVLEGEQAVSAASPLPTYRYFVAFKPDPLSDKSSAYILRVRGTSGNQSEMLPWPLKVMRCTSLDLDNQEFVPPKQISDVSYCRVSDVHDVLVKSPSNRRSYPWKWVWSRSFVGPDTHPCICTPNDDCYDGTS